MSYLVDTNVMVHAANQASPQHEGSRRFLDTCAGQADETWTITWVNVFEYLRIVTHPAIFSEPMSPKMAEENVAIILGLPHVRVIAEDEDFFDSYRVLSGQAGPVSGNLVHDAHIAALMKQEGIKKIYTYDNHFRIFPFLDVRNPLQGA